MRSSRTPVLALGLVGLASVVLAGCTTPSGSASPSASPSTSGSASSRPSATPSASATAVPVSIPCSTLVSAQTVYDFNPIYSVKSPVAPASGTPAARVEKDGGTVCEWGNTSSGAVIDVAVGGYTPAAIDEIRSSTFTGGSTTSGWGGDAGYFAVSAGAGVASALVGTRWVTARGQEFAAASDADPFMTSAVAAVKAAG